MGRDPLTTGWSGRAVQSARALVRTWLPAPCGRCGLEVKATDAWHVGHIKSRHAYPELMWDVSNWQVEHERCSRKSAHEAHAERALRDAGFFPRDGAQGASLLPVSPPVEEVDEGPDQPALPGITIGFTPEAPRAVRPELLWDVERLAEYSWLTDLVTNIPDDANPPLWMSPPPADATGSYGAECIAWIEETQRITLRWWQRLAITRQLEHRDDGSLCTTEYVESAPRRAGKSVRMRGVALWRLADPLDLFGEPQLVMHTGSDMAICREIQRGAWVWARATWGKDSVTVANGKEAVETPDGNRWLVRSQDGVYGYDINLGLIDEGWDVKPSTVADGIDPATLDRVSPQVVLTSTAHPRATSLMPSRILGAITAADSTTVVIVWAAPQGISRDQLADPDVWRAASPFWNEGRHQFIAGKWEKARAARPTPDNPDPIRTFAAQYLNLWTLDVDTSIPGDPITTAATWSTRSTDVPDRQPIASALESWFDAGVSLAVAWRDATGAVTVAVTDHDTVADAVAARRLLRPIGPFIVGANLTDDPALKRFKTTPGAGRTVQAVQALTSMLRDDTIHHDAGTHLTTAVLDVRTAVTPDGPRLVSKGVRGDAIKAAVWAAQAARNAPRRGAKLVTATR